MTTGVQTQSAAKVMVRFIRTRISAVTSLLLGLPVSSTEKGFNRERVNKTHHNGAFYLPRISDVRGNCLATRWNTPLFLGSRNPFSVELTGDRAKVTSQPRSEIRVLIKRTISPGPVTEQRSQHNAKSVY